MFRQANQATVQLPPFALRRLTGYMSTCRSEILSAVDALEASEGYRPVEGRKARAEAIRARIEVLDEKIGSADPIHRLVLVQERMNLEDALASPDADVGAKSSDRSLPPRSDFEFRVRDLLAVMRARGSRYGKGSVSPRLVSMPEFERVRPGIYRRAEPVARQEFTARRRSGGLSTCAEEILEVVEGLEARAGLGDSFECRLTDLVAEFAARRSPYGRNTIGSTLAGMHGFERARPGVYRRSRS